MAIHFQGAVPTQLKDKKRLKAFIGLIAKDFYKRAGSISFSFTNDESILEVNRTYLLHDYYTDIITFDLSTQANIIDADIIVSFETVCTNAVKFKVSFLTELHRVIFHGILHLCGLNDKTKKDKQKMREAEDFYLNKYFP